jgi:hypothetical protein
LSSRCINADARDRAIHFVRSRAATLPLIRPNNATNVMATGINRRRPVVVWVPPSAQSMENDMHMAKKLVIALAATSAVLAPVAASAVVGARAASSFAGENELEGNSSWIIGLVGLLAGVAAIIVIADDDEDSPVSP